MLETIEAICEEGKLKPCVPIDRFEGKRAVVFFFDEKNADSDEASLLREWLLLSEPALNRIWDNPEAVDDMKLPAKILEELFRTTQSTKKALQQI